MSDRLQAPVNMGIQSGVIPNLALTYLKLDGDGVHNLAGEYTPAAPGHFYVQPPANEVWIVRRFMAYLQDGAPFVVTKFGNLDALTNGLKIRQCRCGDWINWFNGTTIKTNGVLLQQLGWSGGQFPIQPAADFGLISAGLDDIWVGLDGGAEDRLEVLAQDDISDVAELCFYVLAYKVVEP